jgi:hypothetical protein
MLMLKPPPFFAAAAPCCAAEGVAWDAQIQTQNRPAAATTLVMS